VKYFRSVVQGYPLAGPKPRKILATTIRAYVDSNVKTKGFVSLETPPMPSGKAHELSQHPEGLIYSYCPDSRQG
jgi:hypothetical protein